MRGVAEAEMRQKQIKDGSRVESRDESRTPAETRAGRERAGRDETQRESAGRDENNAPAETKRVSKERMTA